MLRHLRGTVLMSMKAVSTEWFHLTLNRGNLVPAPCKGLLMGCKIIAIFVRNCLLKFTAPIRECSSLTVLGLWQLFNAAKRSCKGQMP